MLGSGGDSQSATEIELIKSRMIIGQTVDELNLDVDVQPLFPFGAGKGSIAGRSGSGGSGPLDPFPLVPHKGHSGRLFF